MTCPTCTGTAHTCTACGGRVAQTWRERAEADSERLRDALAEVEGLEDALEAARAEVARLNALIKDGFRVGNALTAETQTPEEMAADLVRQVREARQQRDEARTQADAMNKACAEEMLKREGMEKNWDQMARSIKEHHDEAERLSKTLDQEQAMREVAEKFYEVAVKERDAAYTRVAIVMAELEEVRVALHPKSNTGALYEAQQDILKFWKTHYAETAMGQRLIQAEAATKTS